MATTADATAAFLHARGIHVPPERLDSMVIEALRRIRASLRSADPRSVLTRREAEALERGGLDLTGADLGENDPLAQTVSEYTALLKDSLTTREIAEYLGVHPSRIRQRLTAEPPTLFGIRLSDSSWRVPRFQLAGEKLLPGIGEIVAQLGRELHPLSIHRWFTMRNVDLLVEDPGLPDILGKQLSPRDWLLNGLPPQAVADLAKDL